eukprot:1445390-Pleurochrysis_carterae.AAC.3
MVPPSQPSLDHLMLQPLQTRTGPLPCARVQAAAERGRLPPQPLLLREGAAAPAVTTTTTTITITTATTNTNANANTTTTAAAAATNTNTNANTTNATTTTKTTTTTTTITMTTTTTFCLPVFGVFTTSLHTPSPSPPDALAPARTCPLPTPSRAPSR